MKRKLPTAKPTVANLPLAQFAELKKTLIGEGFIEFDHSYKNDAHTLRAKRQDGSSVKYTVVQTKGFRERSISESGKLDIVERRKTAKMLARRHLTQSEIADRLGVSQKTISLDLKS